ncbi:MAG TPA: hypothetical protein VGO59_17990 [Verrucomicrobiae bacterium]|jgi:hypothetical protein
MPFPTIGSNDAALGGKPLPQPQATPFTEPEIVKTPDAEKIITVEVIAQVCIDGERLQEGEMVQISVKQWRALSRHFRWISGPQEHAPALVEFQDAKVITVEVISEVCIEGNRVKPGAKLQISIRLWRALSPNFKFIDGPKHHAPEGWTPAAS